MYFQQSIFLLSIKTEIMKFKLFYKASQFLIITFLFSACKKEVKKEEMQVEIFSAANGINSKSGKVDVSNVEQLYTAVNDPENAGHEIVLAPGTYILNPGYPNSGRIELLHDMSLRGQPGKAEQVIIDGSALPGSSFLLPPHPTFPGVKRTGVIRMGNGTNALEWLTVKGHATTNAYSVIETDLNTTSITNIRVAHCIVTGGQIGLNIRNREAEASGRIIEAEIANNEFTGNVTGFGQGIGFFNARDMTNGIIRARLKGNYVHGNRIGLRAWNVVSNHCSIEIESNADRFEDNGAGLALLGAFNEYPNFTANDNYVSFGAYGSTILNNLGIPAPPSGTAQVFPGGMMAIGAMVSVNSFPATTSNNKLTIKFWGCQFDGNLAPYDINALGARSTYPSLNPAGTNNVVNIWLNGISVNATASLTPSFPIEAAGTNTVNVYR